MSYVETKATRTIPLHAGEYRHFEDIVNRLSIVKFANGKVGLVAQEVYTVWPEGVLMDPNVPDTAVNIDYIALLALALRNIQELNERVNQLEMELVMLR
jgi:hypothetical protein